MKKKQAEMDEQIEKSAIKCDERAERAEVRRLRAHRLGIQREEDGAARTIEEAQHEAAQLRAQISK